ncbi:3'-5' exonuclease [Exilibacterium tricleocarpae]|uniref:3'-5' exonuclease n=1 Tax=Exilibacterium tricleocarpae TaxID=2591008 RepID=A0A545U865_9GAMM|nr:3'-5' exonuclease [Exilibacterium tricleocarpae]TQV85667.1 3'-5' exonuclease [Exilibacterium tricleocarpae]
MAVLYSLRHRALATLRRYRARGTPFEALYDAPPPPLRAAFDDLRFVVLDAEMSGLNPTRHSLLSLGWVVIERGRIVGDSGRHFLIHADTRVGESTKIHGLRDSAIAGAASVARVLALLAAQAQGAVLVFHHAALDIAFIQRAAVQTVRCPLLAVYLDTMEIEKRRLRRQGKSASLRLKLCRDRYGLPATAQHNALSDAYATAELFLAQVAYLGDRGRLRLRDLYPVGVS